MCRGCGRMRRNTDGSAVTDGCAVTARDRLVTDRGTGKQSIPATDAARSRFKPGPNILHEADGCAAGAREATEARRGRWKRRSTDLGSVG
jgi:hypothetical protein